jgi:hypothetical protein
VDGYIREKWRVDSDVKCFVFRGEWRHRDRGRCFRRKGGSHENDGVGDRGELRELSECKNGRGRGLVEGLIIRYVRMKWLEDLGIG